MIYWVNLYPTPAIPLEREWGKKSCYFTVFTAGFAVGVASTFAAAPI